MSGAADPPTTAPRGPYPRSRRLGWLVVALVAAAGVAATFSARQLVATLWPVDLADSRGWLIDWRLERLKDDRQQCGRALATPHISAKPIPDRDESQGCGWSNAVHVSDVGGARLEVAAVSCELAAATALWVNHVVQESAVRHLGKRVKSLDHLGSFACRNIRGSPAFANHRSEHARANALDIRGFVLADGRQIRIARDWGKDTPEARFLADVHSQACRYFRVAIGPAYNAAHRDHFHLDRGRWRACR